MREDSAKVDPETVKIAVRLRKETLVTVAWVLQRVHPASVAHVSTPLHQSRQEGTKG